MSAFYLGLGLLLHDLGRYTTAADGSSSFVSSVFPELVGQFRTPWPLGGLNQENWFFSANLALTPFGHSNPEGGASTRIIRGGARVGREFTLLTPALKVEPLGGTGLMFSYIRGTGGTVSLNNGNTVTQFGLPDRSALAYVFYLEFGFSVEVSKLRWENSMLMSGVLSGRRAVSFVTDFSYAFF